MKGQGPGRAVALAAARKSCEAHVYRSRRQGISVWRSAITAALHVEGVDHLELLEPASDILLNETQAGTCTSVEISMADGESDA